MNKIEKRALQALIKYRTALPPRELPKALGSEFLVLLALRDGWTYRVDVNPHKRIDLAEVAALIESVSWTSIEEDTPRVISRAIEPATPPAWRAVA